LDVPHLLLVTAAHAPQFGIIWSELLSARIALLLDELGKMFGEISCYEHGNATFNVSGTPSVDHAHLHIVPYPVARLSSVGHFRPARWTHSPSLNDAIGHLRGGNYHLLHDGQQTRFTMDELPSQSIRAALAELGGRTSWNWRKDAQRPELQDQRDENIALLRGLGEAG
jgi:diadenosine tetraphosphate (Ap4A) HIT family hydrolase